MTRIFSLCILLSLALNINKVQSQNPFNQFKVDHWDTKKGLPNDLILNLFQGKDGFLWLTSYSGLTRFDGVSFTAFNSRNVPLMKTDNVERIAVGEDSSIWMPTPSSGLLNVKKGIFTSYLKDFYSLLLLATGDSGELLLGTGRSTNHFIFFNTRSKKYVELTDAQRQQLFKEGKLFFRHGTDKDGDQWGNFYDKLVRIHRGEIQALTANEGILPGITYQNFFVDTKNRIWLTSNKGLFLWNGKSMSLYPGMEDKPFLTSNVISSLMLEDRKGGIWAASVAGLAYMPSGTNRFIFIPEKHPLKSQNITNFLEDKEGNIWLSTETGLYKLSFSKFINYSEMDGIFNNRVSGVCAIDSNRYLVSSLGKLYNINHGVVSPYLFKNKELANTPNEFLHFLKDSRGQVWACGNSIVKFSGGKEKVIHTDGPVRFAFEDKDQKMWFGLPFKGIAFLNKEEKLEYLNLPLVNFKTLFLSSIRKLHNGSWLVTTYNNGVLLIDTLGRPTFFKDIEGLPTVGVFESYEDPDGTVWLTTQSGITRYKKGVFAGIGFKEGLPDNALFGYLPDQAGYIWFPSNKGLIRVAKQELEDYLDKKITSIHWRIYDDGDGMLNRQCVGARHGAITPGGKILVLTFGGLVEVDPQKLTTNKVPPPVVIHRVLRDSSTASVSPGSILEPGNHRYIFEYSGLSLTAPEKVQFKFRLIGYDKNWIAAIGDRKAFYTNLPSGDYTFQVIASNNDGIWNETGASFPFSIRPFFYETAWFRILMTALFLLGVWVTVQWRTSAIRKQNELLESQVNARTTDLKEVNLELNKSNSAIAEQRDNLEKTLGELKSTQSQLIQSEKMASLGELTAGIAHEIQNPLNFVNNFSEVNKELLLEMKDEMKKGNMDDANAIANDVIENQEKINHHGKRADAIVKGMLQHSRSSSAIKEPTNINALADEYLRLAYLGFRAKDNSFNATLKSDVDESIGDISIIPQDIGRVLLNLFNNAFYAVKEKHTSTGSALKESKAYEPTVSVKTKKTGEKIFITVQDNGNGIPQKIVDKIFQPFFTTKPTGQGTGLGLSLSYDIVKAHGGEINVQSKEGEGTEFIIQLPLV